MVLGGGNVNSIPPTDCIYKMFVEGNVCILKMNPVNEWVGPFLEQALAPLIAHGASPRGSLGLYHLAWQVDTIEELEEAGLTYFDDFFEMSGNWPHWIRLLAASAPRGAARSGMETDRR